jgi:hypothetical protein
MPVVPPLRSFLGRRFLARRLALAPIGGALLLLLGLAGRASGQERDEWNLQFLGDARCGYTHEHVTAFERDGRRHWRTETESFLAINRLGTTLKVQSSGWVVEDEAGQIVEQHAELDMSAQKQVQHLEVKEDRATLSITTLGPPQVKAIEWKKEYLGPEGRRRFLAAKVKEGAKELDYEDFPLELGAVTIHTVVLGKESLTLPGKEPAELLHLQSTLPNTPGLVTDEWYDESFDARKTVVTQGNFVIITIPSTRAECVDAFAKPDEPEIFAKVSPRSNVRLPDPYHLDELVLRVRKERASDPMPKLEDERQTILEKKADQDLVLRVRRVEPEEKFTLPLAELTDEEKAGLQSNAMIQCDDVEIVKLAKQAVGDEKDAWAAAGKLERFAHGYIKAKGYGTGFASASEVCRDKTGDCSEHGVFLAALCRAAGIPARVAVGLLYFGGGAWGGHMWAEVSLGGKWYAIDAVLGHGYVDAAHLRLAADPLNEIGIERAFANVSLGLTMDIDVVSYRHGTKEMKVGEDAVVFKVDGRRYEHLLYGFTLDAPEAYEIKPNSTISLADNRVVELEGKGKPDVDVDVIDVNSEFDLDQVKAILSGQGVARVKATDRQIDGRPAKLFRGRKDAKEVVVAAVLREETLFLIGAHLGEGEADAALVSVLDSIDLDAGQERQ